MLCQNIVSVFLTVSIIRAAAACKASSPADYLKARFTADYCGASRVGLMRLLGATLLR